MSVFSKIAAAVALSALSASAFAFPIAAPGTEGVPIIAAGGEVFATYLGNSAAYSNDLLLNGNFIFNNHSTQVGTTVSLGSFARGTELVFQLRVNNTGDSFYSGLASRNIDNLFHARAQANYGSSGTTLVSFEDLRGTPEGVHGYNDLSFSFTNTTAPVPEPETYAMMLAGLAGLGFVARRKKTSAVK